MILILSYDDHLIIIWPLSSSLTMNLNLLRFALFSPNSKLPMMQTSFPHIIIGHCFYASMHHLVQFQGNFWVCAWVFYASLHLLVQFLAWLQAWKVISVCARAFYASLHLFVQFQEQFLCVQGRNMFLCFCVCKSNLICVCKGNLCFYALFGAIPI